MTSRAECDDYAKTHGAHDGDGESLPADGNVRYTVTPVHGANSRETSDIDFCAPVDDNEVRTYVATDALSASTTLPKLRLLVNTGIGKRPAVCVGVSFLGISTLTPSENRHRQGRTARTVPGMCFQLVLPDEGNAVNEE